MGRRIVVLYGSQTGNAESVAKKIHLEAIQHGYDSHFLCMKNYEQINIEKEPIVVLVCSTTGNGEVPENAAKFARFLKKKHPADYLSAVNFTVLGLGDSNYDKFCAAGKFFDHRFHELGAKRFYKRGDADDGTCLEEVVEPWIANLWNAIDSVPLPSDEKPSEQPQEQQPALEPIQSSGSSSSSPPTPVESIPAKVELEPLTARLVILYGSQTGNAEAVAKRIFIESQQPQNQVHTVGNTGQQIRLESQLLSMKSYESISIEKQQFVIMVCSTTGNGEVPENAAKFARFLKRKHPSDFLSSIHYTVLGLGDSNYDKFCAAGKFFDTRFHELSAHKFYARGDADDGTALEIVIEPWVAGLWDALFAEACKLLKPIESSIAAASAPAAAAVSSPTKSSPVPSPSTPRSPPIHPAVNHPYPSPRNPPSATPLTLVTPCQVRVEYLDSAPLPSSPSPSHSSSSSFDIPLFDAQNPFMAKLLLAKNLTAPDAVRRVIHMSFDITNSAFSWAPGDAIGVVCPNDSTLVDSLLLRLGLDGSRFFKLLPSSSSGITTPEGEEDDVPSGFPSHIKTPCTVRDAFLKHVDLLCTRRSILRVLSEYCSDPQDKRYLFFLSSAPGAHEHRVNVLEQRLNLLEVLEMVPSCHPPLDHLLDSLLPLQPRFYSISCSQLVHPSEIHIAFTQVSFSTPRHGKKRLGLCSNWLASLADQFLLHSDSDAPIHVPIFLKTTPEFRIPSDPITTPVIMIGPGTGVSPFRGFLQERQAIIDAQSQSFNYNTIAPWWLFFGCRLKSKDFLYRGDLEALATGGSAKPGGASAAALNRLVVACSQESDGAVWYGGAYVQDYMREHATFLYDLMVRKGAYVYVCGDANSMSRDVHRILVDILEEVGKMTRPKAQQLLEEWDKEGRYQKDIWS